MYSQSEEERYILEAFYAAEQRIVFPGSIKADVTEPGRLLDIGCWDPITFSNSRRLIELGWSAVLIEPAPGPFLELLKACTRCGVGVDQRPRQVYGDRKERVCVACGANLYGTDPNITLILGAVTLDPGLLKLEVTDDALSTGDENSRKTWEKVGGFYGSLLVNSITLEQIANQFGGFDFVNIDAEGLSAELFLKMLTLGWQAKCVCVEHDGRLVELAKKATGASYTMTYSNDTNAVFVR